MPELSVYCLYLCKYILIYMITHNICMRLIIIKWFYVKNTQKIETNEYAVVYMYVLYIVQIKTVVCLCKAS